jgi:hypothetical protein
MGTKLNCRFCGRDHSDGDAIRAWYPVDEGQSIRVWLGDDGTVEHDYTGDTRSGESGSDESYWCTYCDGSARSLEFLLGLTDEDTRPTVTLSAEDADIAADACDYLAGIDEGENMNDEELYRVAKLIRSVTFTGEAEPPVRGSGPSDAGSPAGDGALPGHPNPGRDRG